MTLLHRAAAWSVLALALAGADFVAAEEVTFSETEIRRILDHGPWPPDFRPDPSNRLSGKPDAISLGRALFFDPRLSAGGALSCAGCHQPAQAFTDGKTTSLGRVRLDRNAPSVLNLMRARWFGWDGSSDSLWAASIRPLLSADEMAIDGEGLVRLLTREPGYAQLFKAGVGEEVTGLDPEQVLVAVGKSLAAYMETLVSDPSAFDHFRDSLERGQEPGEARFSSAARRGLKIFVGKGRCFLCHFGPAFTNGAFADVGRPHFRLSGGVDRGRYGGIQALRSSPYNLLGTFNDRPETAAGAATNFLVLQPRNFGEFKVPSLRQVKRTAPYMHDGSLASLEDVVRYYSGLDTERLHSDGERILRPLGLNDREVADLVAFLETL